LGENPKYTVEQFENLEEGGYIKPREASDGPGVGLGRAWHCFMMFSDTACAIIDRNNEEDEEKGGEHDEQKNGEEKIEPKKSSDFGICIICRKVLDFTNVGSASSHLSKAHAVIHTFLLPKFKPYEVTLVPKTEEVFVGPLDRHFQRTDEKIRDLLVSWIAESNRPLGIVDDPGFREVINEIKKGGDDKIPSRRTISRHVSNLAERIKNDKKKKLKLHFEAGGLVVLTTDGWSSLVGSSSESYITLFVHYTDHEGVVQAMHITTEEMKEEKTALNQRKKIREIIDEYEIFEERIFVVITDQGPDVQCAFNNPLPLSDGRGPIQPPFQCHWGYCQSHRLNNAVKKIFLSPGASCDTIITKVKDLVSKLRTSKVWKVLEKVQKGEFEEDKLDELLHGVPEEEPLLDEDEVEDQPAESSALNDDLFDHNGKRKNGPPLRVLAFNETRWTSFMVALKRIWELRNPLTMVYEILGYGVVLSTREWLSIENLLIVLEPVYNATINLQGDRNYGEGLIILRRLVLDLEKIEMEYSNPSIPLASQFKQELLSRFGESDQTRLMCVSLILDPKYSKRFDKIAQMLSYSPTTLKENCIEQIRKDAEECYQLSNPNHHSPPSQNQRNFQDMLDISDDEGEEEEKGNEGQIETELEGVASQSRDAIPSIWWHNNKHRYPCLAPLALVLAAIPSSSVYPEREFSYLGNTLTELRNRLAPTMVKDLSNIRTHIKSNR